MMRIIGIRLVNFHNFVNETIDVEDGGHLFLLGDNGSGKTTVLDAVHYVLAGGQLELNAAARLGGRRDEGRTIQGVVLRHDFERGVRNQGGAVAYAAIEIEDGERGQRLSLGVGTEATTLEARVTRWGFVSGRPLAEIPLTVTRDGRRFAASREGLVAALGGGEVFLRIGDYRAAVASRVMGGTERYREICDFWNMAKSYREIVQGARDFDGLFRRLLPAPDPKVFGEIIRSLRKIGDLEVALGEIEAQRDYVGGLLELAEEVTVQRQAASRYEWLACHRRRQETQGEIEQSRRRSAGLEAELEQMGHRAEVAEARAGAADDAVRAAQAQDAEGVAVKLRDAERARGEAQAIARGAEREEERAQTAAAHAEGAAAEARAALDRETGRVRSELSAAIDACSTVPGDLPRCRRLVDGMLDAPPSAWAGPWAEAQAEARGVETSARARAKAAAARLERARVEREACERERDRLARQKEEEPRVEGLAAARRALEAAGVSAKAVYELCEPRADAAPERLAWLEEMAGDAALAALVVGPADRRRASELVGACAPGVRVLVRVAEAATLPGWAAVLFDQPAGGGGGEAAEARRAALAALAQAVEQGLGLGPVGERDTRGLLEHRGAAWAPERDAPRLLGAAARRRAHEARLLAVEEALARAEGAERAAVAAAADADTRVQRLVALVAAVAGAHSPELARAESLAESAAETAALRRELAAEAAGRAEAARTRAEAAAALVAALEARATAMDLDALQARIAELESLARAARAEWTSLLDQRGSLKSQLGREEAGRVTLEERAGGLDSELARLGHAVRALVAELAGADDAALEHALRVTGGGDRFKSIEAIGQRVAECRRREQAAADELERDGSRGVRHIQYAARFGFGYDRVSNQLSDRRDQPAAGVLADLDRTLAEQRGVITAGTRELMETLVVSSLARDLQTQIERLERVMKDINRLLGGIRFGRTAYRFRAAVKGERRELVEVVRRISVLDADSRAAFRSWIEDRRDELRLLDDDCVPDMLDYRTWYEFSLRQESGGDGAAGDGGVELTRSVRALGSGGEQGVPNYLLVLALAALMFEGAQSRLRPLLFDEAFYGIDAGRRDQLLRFGTQLGLQLLVASPDQDGVTPSVRAATTLFVVKDAHGDVHLAPYHYWHKDPAPQTDLFAPEGAAPASPPPSAAECRLAPPTAPAE